MCIPFHFSPTPPIEASACCQSGEISGRDNGTLPHAFPPQHAYHPPDEDEFDTVSAKVLSFARLARLEVADTLHLFGSYYRHSAEDDTVVQNADYPAQESSEADPDEGGDNLTHVGNMHTIKQDPSGNVKEWPPPDVANLKAFENVRPLPPPETEMRCSLRLLRPFPNPRLGHTPAPPPPQCGRATRPITSTPHAVWLERRELPCRPCPCAEGVVANQHLRPPLPRTLHQCLVSSSAKKLPPSLHEGEVPAPPTAAACNACSIGSGFARRVHFPRQVNPSSCCRRGLSARPPFCCKRGRVRHGSGEFCPGQGVLPLCT